jgi:peptide deformylase
MGERPILQLGDPRLWSPSESVPDAQHQEIQAVITDLDDTLARFRSTTGWGRGISAVQIGSLKRITFVRLVPEDWKGKPGLTPEAQRKGALDTIVFLNPRIVERSRETFDLWEDCFSFPNLLVRVSRHYRIAVRFEDERGKSRDLQAEGALSELLQHEFDHLDGILAIDRRIDERSLCLREEYERRYGGTPEP